MKKQSALNKLKSLGIVSILALSLAGCQNSTDREDALEDQVAHLEQQVTSLQKENEELVSNAAETNKSSASAQTSEKPQDDMDSLNKAVNDIIEKSRQATADGSESENKEAFYSLIEEFESIEDRLEAYENYIENQHDAGTLSYEEARDAEQELEKLDDKLDDAEDNLEDLFGYDD